MSEAAEVATLLSDDEHCTVIRLASIMILGYLLPYSTGNDFYLLEDFQRDHTQGPVDIEKEIIQLPLETRLEKSIRNLPVNELGDILTDPYHEVAFHDFLHKGLAPLLKSRIYPRDEVDLLHILAMIIHPCPTTHYLPHYYEHDCSIWRRTLELVECSYGCHFQIQYRHRIQTIQILAECLTLPPLQTDSIQPITALLRGAVPHLQASLHCFSIGALSKWDAHLAMYAKVNLIVQTQNVEIMRDAWDSLLGHFGESSSNHCCCSDAKQHRKRMPYWTDQPKDETTFCQHSAWGQLLSFFIVQSCFTYDLVDPELLYKIVEGLGERIEWQLEHWKKGDESTNGEDSKQPNSPCLLSALLFAVRHAFLFRPSRLKDEDDDPCEILLKCAIQLLGHPDAGISEQSAKLLSTAFCQDRDNDINAYAVSLFHGIYEMLKGDGDVVFLTELVGVATEQLPQHGLSFMSYLLEPVETDSEVQLHRRLQVVAAIATNYPLIAFKMLDQLTALYNSIPPTASCLLFPAISSSRLARFFPGNEDEHIQNATNRILPLDAWSRYKSARQSIASGNFAVASDLLNGLLEECSNENHYLWIEALEQLSLGESTLALRASLGIPKAVEELQRAVSRLQCIRDTTESYDFSVRFLLLRLDFLDLVTVLRQLTREMRLTGSGPSKKTRNYTYLLNTIQAFKILSLRFKDLCWNEGVRFRHYQSRLALRLNQDMALFLSSLAQILFANAKLAKQKTSFQCNEAIRHPMAALMRKMSSALSEESEPIARAEVLLQILDGMLMTPVPIPRDFFLPKPERKADLQLLVSSGGREHDIIHAMPTVGFEFQVVGGIPPSLLNATLDPIATILIWFRVSYVSPLDEEDGNKDDEEVEADPTAIPVLPDMSRISPWTGRFCSDGRFAHEIDGVPIAEEGVFLLEAQLGCQDVAGRSWKLQSSPASIQIRVARPR